MMTRAVSPPHRVPVSFASLETMSDVARRAARAAMTFYGQPGEVRQKGVDGPVTEADRASHEVIVEALRSWADIPVISEEMPVPAYEVRRRWSRFWLVDPLDGTKEFLAKHGEFTINIALVEGDRPVLGVVYAPVEDVMYLAGCALGSWRQTADGTIDRLYSAPKPAGERVRIVESRSHRSDAQEVFLRSLPVAERTALGSSLKFCRVAEGSADVYPRFVPAMEWDLAAGDCVYRHSGRGGERVSPLRYNGRDLRIPGFVIGL